MKDREARANVSDGSSGAGTSKGKEIDGREAGDGKLPTLSLRGGMKQELQTMKKQVEKRVLALMIKLWNQMIKKKELKRVS
ncbi:hypothetical protein IGI04_042577 [Brassica rapa subsp. trilocularis]|uniref:Uncharacterized protein n=1 Tax=Brassica rapa subsp. trilocularis TaxID=1813537 RepID=A0ABQ7KI06_BRACM|nr:hypothetical protein IGI04_042577 [Brassica rapa subsp. trilocularis]